MTTRRPDLCPCGTGDPYVACCGALHQHRRGAATAEELMRARYSAHAVGDGEFLAATWAERVAFDLPHDQRWLGLAVLATERGGEHDTHGVVEFIAHFSIGDRTGSHHERSIFERHDGRWVYCGSS